GRSSHRGGEQDRSGRGQGRAVAALRVAGAAVAECRDRADFRSAWAESGGAGKAGGQTPAGRRTLLSRRPDHRSQQPFPCRRAGAREDHASAGRGSALPDRSEEHTSELQSRENLVCRLLLEKKKKNEHK